MQAAFINMSESRLKGNLGYVFFPVSISALFFALFASFLVPVWRLSVIFAILVA